MDEAGTLPANIPPRRWNLGDESPVGDPVAEIPAPVMLSLRSSAQQTPELPADYGDAGGLWVTVRSQNPFNVLLLNDDTELSSEAVLGRFRVLWKFWSQKLTVSRQGASRTAIRQKYGEHIDTYVENLQWAYDQLTADDGISFWRMRAKDHRLMRAWSRISDSVEATLADGMLSTVEVDYLLTRAESIGYGRDEFAAILRDVLHTRRFEPEVAPSGHGEAARLASVRWATADMWAKSRTKLAPPPVSAPMYYVRARGQTFGPMTGDAVRDMVATRRAGPGDSVCAVGAGVWQPISQSQFGFVGQTLFCPRCGTAMSPAFKSSSGGWVLVILGIFLTVILIGIPLIIIGIVMINGKGRQTYWRCARCGYVP